MGTSTSKVKPFRSASMGASTSKAKAITSKAKATAFMAPDVEQWSSEASTTTPSDSTFDDEYDAADHQDGTIVMSLNSCSDKYISRDGKYCLPGVPYELHVKSNHYENAKVPAHQGEERGFADVSAFDSRVTGDWRNPMQTLIIFDWDDTLCPTASCAYLIRNRGMHGVARSSALLAHEAAVVAMLHEAASFGGVAIITMADHVWVKNCIDMLMPEVGQTLKNLGIEIILARNFESKGHRESLGDCKTPSQYLKSKAISYVAKHFYGARGVCVSSKEFGETRSWKNIIGIGDSDAERLGLIDTVLRYNQPDRHGHCKKCRCKTVRFLEDPALEDLTEQIRTLQKLLGALVFHDGDFNVDMSGFESFRV